MTKIRVSVVEAFPDGLRAVELLLDAGATVAEALRTAEAMAAFPDAPDRPFGVYSRRVEETDALRDGDRIELYRPLIADAKQNRMARVKAAREAKSPR